MSFPQFGQRICSPSTYCFSLGRILYAQNGQGSVKSNVLGSVRFRLMFASPLYPNPQRRANYPHSGPFSQTRRRVAAPDRQERTHARGFFRRAGCMKIARQLIVNCQRRPERKAWMRGLPVLLKQLEARWSLRLGEPFDHAGSCSWVAPATRANGEPAVLKLAMPHMEGQDEIPGLRFWGGNTTVRLLEADAESGAMLLERCLPGNTLHSESETRQDEVVANLLRRIWSQTRSADDLAGFRPLSLMVKYWCGETVAQRHFWPDPELVNEGLRVFRELARPALTDVLLATDLHAGNILRSRREAWLVIDPKPFVGDRAYDPVQHLMNCEARLHDDPIELVRRVADLAEVDAERLRLWTFARAAADPRDDWKNARWMRTARKLAL
jgi:streptomycin 6-kinase